MVSFVSIPVFIGSVLLFHLLKFRKAGNLSLQASFVIFLIFSKHGQYQEIY